MNANAIPPPEYAPIPRARDRTRAIGAILVDQGRLRDSDVREIESHARAEGIRFGDAALQLNLLSPADIEEALRTQFRIPILTHGDGGAVSSDVITAYDPTTLVAEQLRTARTRLALGWLQNAERGVLAITSPQRGEGRSWFAANLATVFAQARTRTLLIDTDLRNPRQHKLFNVNNCGGLSALLSGRAGKEVAQRVDPRLRLFVLPAGAIPPNPQELLLNSIFDIVIDRFASQFDLIILDTPAASASADVEVIASHAGAAVVLSRRDHTRHRDLVATREHLTRSGVKLIGSVINEF